jgi:TonB family protein
MILNFDSQNNFAYFDGISTYLLQHPKENKKETMKYLLLSLLLCFSLSAFSQSDTTTYGYVNRTLIQTEITPVYPGGPASWKRYLDKNLEQQGISGTVVVAFTVKNDGKTSDFEVIKSINPDLDKEAVRLVKNSGTWIPAIQNGKKVKYRNRVEIAFQ